MNLKKLYFVIKRFSILRATHFTYHFFILKNQLNSHFKNKLKSFQIFDPGTLPEKYLDLSMWIFENLIRAFDANLDRSSDLRILDIGCGPGYFIYIANYFRIVRD